MQSFSRSIIGTLRRVGSAPPRWWLPAPARRDASLMASLWAYPNQYLDCLFRNKKQSKLDCRICFSSASIQGMDKAEMKKAAEINCVLETRVTKDVGTNSYVPDRDLYPVLTLSGSTHRDGAVYRRRDIWMNTFDVDITDRTETWLEPTCLAVDNKCNNDPKYCGSHFVFNMMQFISLKLAKAPCSSCSVQLYGYIAARDEADFKLNYVFNRSRDDPIIVKQGSLIEMTGPKRGIILDCNVVLEYDLRIKTEEEEDDQQLIDGLSVFDMVRLPLGRYKTRIEGHWGAVDMSLSTVPDAVGAIVEVIISEVQSGFDFSLSSVVSIMDEREEYQLFHGTVSESGERRFMIAVSLGTVLRLKLKVGQKGFDDDVTKNLLFTSKLHGYASRQIKLKVASILVKVTWAGLPG